MDLQYMTEPVSNDAAVKRLEVFDCSLPLDWFQKAAVDGESPLEMATRFKDDLIAAHPEWARCVWIDMHSKYPQKGYDEDLQTLYEFCAVWFGVDCWAEISK